MKPRKRVTTEGELREAFAMARMRSSVAQSKVVDLRVYRLARMLTALGLAGSEKGPA